MKKIEINLNNPQTYDNSVMNIIGEQNNYYDNDYIKEKQKEEESMKLLVRAQAKLFIEEEQLKDKGKLIIKSEKTIFGGNWIEIYENAVIGHYYSTDTDIFDKDRNFRHGFVRIWLAGSKRNNVSIYVDENPQQRFLHIASNGMYYGNHLYYAIYSFVGIKNAKDIKEVLYERIRFHHPEEA